MLCGALTASVSSQPSFPRPLATLATVSIGPLPLNVDARRTISDYLEVRPAVSSDALFIGQRGDHLGPRAVEQLVAKYARLAGLEDVTPHTLRHSFGKHTLDAGADLVAVAALLGHERLETTAIYTTPSQRDLERMVEKLEQDGDVR